MSYFLTILYAVHGHVDPVVAVGEEEYLVVSHVDSDTPEQGDEGEEIGSVRVLPVL